MSLDRQRWDPNSQQFVIDTLRFMVGLWIAVSIVGTILYHTGWLGFLTGGAFALALYLVAIHSGRILASTGNYAQTMRWLLLSQFILWIGMALVLAVAKVNPIGFVIGVSILLVAILGTLGWYAIRRRRLPS
ncbi:MAG TPA: hypothetical protein VHV83_04920 [Armatimonadota bacterium]|nr:hypothetical protein [Armatimonadota bacterium]